MKLSHECNNNQHRSKRAYSHMRCLRHSVFDALCSHHPMMSSAVCVYALCICMAKCVCFILSLSLPLSNSVVLSLSHSILFCFDETSKDVMPFRIHKSTSARKIMFGKQNPSLSQLKSTNLGVVELGLLKKTKWCLNFVAIAHARTRTQDLVQWCDAQSAERENLK